jgi:CheY-like chemotaxis protein
MPQAGTILLAEDDENDVILIQRAFADAGVREEVRAVREVADLIRYLDGEGAFANRREYPFPRLLLLDVKMGNRNGLDALRWLQERPALRRRLAVVVLSAVDLPEAIESAYSLGVNSYLLKPFDYNRLVELAKQTKEYWLDFNRLPSAGNE